MFDIVFFELTYVLGVERPSGAIGNAVCPLVPIVLDKTRDFDGASVCLLNESNMIKLSKDVLF